MNYSLIFIILIFDSVPSQEIEIYLSINLFPSFKDYDTNFINLGYKTYIIVKREIIS